MGAAHRSAPPHSPSPWRKNTAELFANFQETLKGLFSVHRTCLTYGFAAIKARKCVFCEHALGLLCRRRLCVSRFRSLKRQNDVFFLIFFFCYLFSEVAVCLVIVSVVASGFLCCLWWNWEETDGSHAFIRTWRDWLFQHTWKKVLWCDNHYRFDFYVQILCYYL